MVGEDSLSHVSDSVSENMTKELLEEEMDIDMVYQDKIEECCVHKSGMIFDPEDKGTTHDYLMRTMRTIENFYISLAMVILRWLLDGR